MFGGNRISKIISAGIFLVWASLVSAQQGPLVLGYERFHRDAPSMEGGRILFNELGCVNCHDHPTGLPDRKGPVLEGVVKRVHADWIRAFLKDPVNTKPGTSMPQMLLKDREIEAVVHYLATLEPEKKIPAPFAFVNAERGIALYHEIGCVACHAPSSDFHPTEGQPSPNAFTYPHVPLPDLKEKYDFASLTAFLYDPHQFRPDGRMPKFELGREDGGDLVAHLLDFQDSNSLDYPSIPQFTPDPELAEIGKIIVELRNCSACHDSAAPDPQTPRPKTPLGPDYQSLDKLVNHPKYQLTENQNQSIVLFLQSTPVKEAPALSHLQALNCLACHDRDGLGGPDAAHKVYFTGNHDLGDTGRYPPPLTEVGRKLQPKWLRGVLVETKKEEQLKATKNKKNTLPPEPEIDYKVRPYLNVQMPVFGASVRGLPEVLIHSDQLRSEPALSSGELEAGRKLLGTQGGLNCITCHGWNERESLGIRALNLSTLAQRLQPGWLQNYLIDPAIYRPNTLMPSFWPGGKASNTEILNGDTRAQIAAIYAFAKKGKGLPEGFPNEDTAEYEIIPIDRPVVQRCFMEGVGTKAILVGFPGGIHLAIDGQTGQPALMWKGRFFDAYRTWYSRFPEFEKPLGKDVVKWPVDTTDETSQYRGYRLDSAGIPEFMIDLNGAKAFERFIPVKGSAGQPAMQRVIRYTKESQLNDPRLSDPAGVDVREVPSKDPMTRMFIYQW